MARFFGPKTLGEINVTINFCLLITIFITNFFGSSGNKLLAEYRGRKNKSNFIYTFKIIFFGSMGTLIISCISLFFLWEYIFKRFSLSEELLFPIIIFIFLRTVYILLRKTFYGVDLVKQYTLNEILSAIVMLLMIGYVCIYNWPKLLIHTYLISYSCFIMLGVNTLIKNWKKITKKMDMAVDFSRKNVIREFSIYGLVSMVGTVASTGTGYISIVITGVYLNSTDAGLYSSILSILSIFMFLPKIFMQVFIPEFSKLYGQKNKTVIISVLKTTSLFLLFLSSFICSLVYAFSENILSLFGENFILGDTALKILIPSTFFRMISIPLISFLSGTKYVIYPNLGGLIIFFTSLIMWIVLVPNYELNGIAIGYSIGIFVGIVFQMIIALFKINSFLNA